LVPSTSLALRVSLLPIARRFVWIALFPGALLAQATQTVPPDDPVYAFIDRLVASRLVDTVIVGQRPMSRREVGRIIASAWSRAGESGWFADRIRSYAVAFPDSGSRQPSVSELAAEASAMESPARQIVSDFNGAIVVQLNPISSNQLGRPTANGTTLSYRGSIGAGVTSWLAVAAAQRVSRLDERGSSDETVHRFDQLYARALWKNASLAVGRDYQYLGQAASGGLMASLNGPSVNMVRVSSDRPFVWPWLLRYIGPTRASVLLGDLGPHQRFPHARLFAYKMSVRPHRLFEMGVGLSEQVGGQGSPPGTLLQKAVDAFPLLDAIILHRRTEFSNKLVAVDIRYSIPGIRGAQFYAEGAFDDFDLRRVRSTFTEDAGYVWGLSSSCLGECGPARASLEYHVTGLRYYTHGLFANGFTVDQMLIGDQLGPRARGGYGSVDIDRGAHAIGVQLGYEDRSGNLYRSVTTTADDSDFRFEIMTRRPAERRWRIMPSLTVGGLSDRLTFTARAGAERVENFGHVEDAWRTNWLTQLVARVRPTLPFF
jgi:hypothetical protein